METVYILENTETPNHCKVGMTIRNGDTRGKEVNNNTGVIGRWQTYHEFSVVDAAKAEKAAHGILDAYRNGEHAGKEIFNLSPADAYVKLKDTMKEFASVSSVPQPSRISDTTVQHIAEAYREGNKRADEVTDRLINSTDKAASSEAKLSMTDYKVKAAVADNENKWALRENERLTDELVTVKTEKQLLAEERQQLWESNTRHEIRHEVTGEKHKSSPKEIAIVVIVLLGLVAFTISGLTADKPASSTPASDVVKSKSSKYYHYADDFILQYEGK